MSVMLNGCNVCTRHGLLRVSFRPKGEVVELRAYLRQRERLLDYGANIQHVQKALIEMNLQLHHVVWTSPERLACASSAQLLPASGIPAVLVA
jgi:transposase